MTTPSPERLLELAARCEAYDPRQSPDNRADELELHRDIVLTTGLGSMNPSFDATFPRSLDAARQLVPEGALWKVDHGIAWSDEQPANEGRNYCAGVGIGTVPAKWSAGVSASSPALALTAAALRSLAEEGEGE